MKVALRLLPVPLLDICLAFIEDTQTANWTSDSQKMLKEKFIKHLSPRAGGDKGEITVTVELDYTEFLQCMDTVRRILAGTHSSDALRRRLREATAGFAEKELLVAVANADGCDLVTLP